MLSRFVPQRRSRTVLCLALALLALITGCKHADSTRAAAETSGQGREVPYVAEPNSATATAASAAAPAPATLPRGVDAKDLPERDRQTLFDILTEQFDPCGKPRTMADALQAGDCTIAPKLAALIVRLLREGQTKKEVIRSLLEEVERLNTVATFQYAGAPLLGPEPAVVPVVLFSDFECPYCRKVAAPIEMLQKHYGCTVYFKSFPLRQNHVRAEPAARAAWAAHRQGKFWQMHDALFTAKRLEDADFKRFAAKIGLDAKRFQADYASPEALAAIDADIAEGSAAGVQGTPTFFVNGRLTDGLDKLQEAIREALTDAGRPVPEALSSDALEAAGILGAP
jgi:protein-disulfide isomerase